MCACGGRGGGAIDGGASGERAVGEHAGRVLGGPRFWDGEHGFRTKLAPYDATYRSPLIIAKPGLAVAGGVCRVPVNAPDLVATFVSQANVEVPWALHGRDLSGLLRRPEAAWPHPCLYEFSGETYGSSVASRVNTEPGQAEYHQVPWYTAVVQDGWKLIHYVQPGVGDELYDTNRDPEELENRIGVPEAAERLAGLRKALRSELERTQAGFGVTAW